MCGCENKSSTCIQLPSDISPYFSVDKYFSELNTEEKRNTARINLGLNNEVGIDVTAYLDAGSMNISDMISEILKVMEKVRKRFIPVVYYDDSDALIGEITEGDLDTFIGSALKLDNNITLNLDNIKGKAEIVFIKENSIWRVYSKSFVETVDPNDITLLESSVSNISSKIPSQATSSNQLADKNFVNSSISTATATFRDSYNLITDLNLSLNATPKQKEDALGRTVATADNNDYAFILIPTSTLTPAQIKTVERYKYSTDNKWHFEYELNNSGFTANQWAAINSGLTSNDRSIIDAANTNSQNAVSTANTASSNASNAVEVADNNAHIVANLEGAWTGTSPILEFSTTTEYGTGANQVHYCYHEGLLYRATATHTGEWNAEHFEAINMIDLLETYENMVVGDKTVNEFDPEKEYTAGDPVIYNNEFYIFKRGHTGEWDEIDVDKTSFIEWLKNLSDTIETYVGNGKEQVVVSCSTEAQGVSMAGLTLMVYLNGSTTEAEEYTTDSHGMATFRIPVGYTYRIVYPSVAGVVTPAPETHTASVGQRSVEVRYDVVPAPPVEIFTISFLLVTENTVYLPYQGQIIVTKGGSSTTYTAGTNGIINVEIPIGTAYTVDVVKPEGLHIKEGAYHWDFVAESSIRAKAVTFYEYLDGILLTDAAGNDYTFDQFKSLVEQGVLAKGDAKYIHLCTNVLLTHAVVEGTDSTCYVSIYEIGKRKYHDTDDNFANMQWCNNNVPFVSIPNNIYQYDGKYRTAQIIAEGIERGYTTPAATRLSGMSYTFTNSSATVITGFLASRGQFDALGNNRLYIDEILDYVYDGEEYLTFSSFTVNKWSSDQVGTNAYRFFMTNWGFDWSKGYQCMVVPFYA